MCLFEFIRVEGGAMFWNILMGDASYKSCITIKVNQKRVPGPAILSEFSWFSSVPPSECLDSTVS
jgi:hypothetical protein